jgi:hypothetical protein
LLLNDFKEKRAEDEVLPETCKSEGKKQSESESPQKFTTGGAEEDV